VRGGGINEFSVQQIFELLLITTIASPIVLVFTACWVNYFLLSIFECELLWILVHSASTSCFLLLLVIIIWCKWLISLFRKVWCYCRSYIVPFIVCPVVNSYNFFNWLISISNLLKSICIQLAVCIICYILLRIGCCKCSNIHCVGYIGFTVGF
jgi:hypothetical protein